MKSFLKITLLGACALSAGAIFLPDRAEAQSTSSIGQTRGASGLPLPRYVSIKARRVNMRIGPGRDYPVDWMYLKSGLPIEIIQEYGNWMRVRDADGAQGWIYRSLLSGKRTAVIAPWNRGKEQFIELHDTPKPGSHLIANIEPGATARINSCDGQWCFLEFAEAEGWVKQSQLWGAYPDEVIED